MMAEESEASAVESLADPHASPQERLEREKTELIAKLKKAVVAGKAMKKQLADVNATKDADKQQLVAKLQDVIARYQAMQQQREEADEKLQVAQSRVDAFKLELQAQHETATRQQEEDAQTIRELNDELHKVLTRCAQEEARVMVFQEENNRLTQQVAAMLEDKQQQERETQELVADNHSLQTKVDDLAQQVSGARQQQEDTEQMYMEVASKLNQALRDNDELQKSVEKMKQGLNHDAGESVGAGDKLETQIAALEAELAGSAGKWELEKKQLTQQIEAMTSSANKANAELTEAAEIREQLLVHVGIDLTYESIESLLDTKNNEIQMLTDQLATAEGPQEQAIHEAVSAAVTEVENLRSRLDTLQARCDSLSGEKIEQEKTIEELRVELQRVAEEHSVSLRAEEDKRRRASESLEEKQAETDNLAAQLLEAHNQKQQLHGDFSAITTKIDALVAALQINTPTPTETDGATSSTSELAKLGLYLDCIQEQFADAAKPRLQGEAELLQERIHKYETENQQLILRLEECEIALKERASEIEKLAARGLDGFSDTNKYASSGEDAASVSSNGETAESCNGDSSLERELEATKAQLHAVEAEMAACKAENMRMVFDVAKTADGVSKLKQDHETLLETHRKQTCELEVMVVQLASLKSANQTLEAQLNGKSEDLRCHLETFAMQKEDFESVVTNLNSAVVKVEKENRQIKRDLDDIKTENDVLEERISELHAVADCRTEPDEWQEKDREVEELRSSLVQAKVDFLEQKQQLTALEKKLVQVSKSGGPTCTVNSAALDAERREFEAALIEMIEMEKKLQVAYEAKQGLESTLQERMEAKAELEDRLSVAEDKIAELEQQLEQKVALIATIEEQLRSVEEEREKLADELAKTRSKLERSRGKLEEKTIEFEAFKTTTNMLKDERSRLFNEIAMLKDKIARSEVQKAAMADSQELANEELEEQLNELADKIAEIETEKQDLRARLEETVYRSEEDIHQLRERLYMLEEEKSSLDDENLKLEETIDSLEAKLGSLEEQKTELEAANELSSQQMTLLEERVEKATNEIATLSAEKNKLAVLQQSLEDNVSALQDEKMTLERTLEETTLSLRGELEQVTSQVETLQTQLIQTTTEKDDIAISLTELQKQTEADKVVSGEVSAKLEAQIAENATLENKITALKLMAEKALQSLQANRDELSEAESRAAAVVEERDSVNVLLQEKESELQMTITQREDLQHQVEKLTSETEDLRLKLSEEANAAEETIRSLKDAEVRLTEALESAKRDLAEAESCVMVLVEERDAARRDLTAKDLKIEMLTTQQGELDLVAQKLENELNTVKSKSSAEAEATEDTIRTLNESKAEAETEIQNLKDSSVQAEESLQAIQKQLAESEMRVAALEKERDATRTFLNEKESTHETLNALQEDLLKKVDALETELNEQRAASAAELATANETISILKAAEAHGEETLSALRQELAEAEGCVMVLVEERDAAKKTLSKRDLTLEVLSSEHGELQLKSQSVTTELEALRNKSLADAQAAVESLQALKQELSCATESVESTQTKLSEAEERVNILTSHVQALEGELQELQNQRETETQTAEETIRSLKESEAQTAETLEAIRQKLSETEARAVSTEEERDAACKALSEMESHREAQSTEVESLQERIQTLEGELQELQNQRETDTQTAEETIRSLKESEAQTAETLEAIRQKLSETEARAVSTEEERDAACKALSEMESHREAQSTEVESLQERIQALEGELQELQNQRETETQTAEETIRSLKESEAQTAETLEAIRQKLSETEARAVSTEEERDAACKALSEMESHREAQSTEVESLQERIQTLEGELQELQNQRETDTQTAEETIRSLKESEAQTAETLEAIRQKLSETEARVVSTEDELSALKVVLGEKESMVLVLSDEKSTLASEAQTNKSVIRDMEAQLGVASSKLAESNQQIEVLENEARQLESQVRVQVQTAEVNSQEIDALRDQVATLSESSAAALSEVTTLREQIAADKGTHNSILAQKDDVISTLKSKLEEVMAAYKRLKNHLQEMQDRLTQQTTTNESLKTSYDELNAQHFASKKDAETLKLELVASREQFDALTDDVRQAGDKLTESEAQRESQLESYKKRILAYDDELAQTQRRYEVALHELNERLEASFAAQQEATHVKLSELEKLCTELTESAEKKELEVHTMVERVRVLEQDHAQAERNLEEAGRKYEAERMELEAQLSSANETIEKLRSASDANVGLQRESISQLENQLAKLKLELEAETEGANAARAALETYKKRAHTALKKASSENKLNLKKAAQSTTKLEQEVVSAKGRISILESDLEESRKQMAELESVREAMAQSAREAVAVEQRSQVATLHLEIDSLKAEVVRLEEVLGNECVPLEAQIKQLTIRNEALNDEIASLRENVRTQNESMDQAVQAKEDEISDLSKQLQAALAAAASLATNEAGRRSYSPTYSPTEKERRSTASSSRSYEGEGNNSFLHQTSIEEQHAHMAAAVADSCPIPLASKIGPTDGVDLVKSTEDESETVSLKLQLNQLESQMHVFRKKYEDTSTLLEETNRQKQRLQELSERSTQAINIEYLKNVVMKYIESQVPSEKEQLVPVISTLLSFSPQEQQKVMAAHSKANEESAGLFGGVFSLFGGGATSAPPPKPLAAPTNLKPSPTTANPTGAALGSKDKNGVLSFGSDGSDDDEIATPLNPFAA